MGSNLSFVSVGYANKVMGGKQGSSVWSNCFLDSDSHNVVLFKKPKGGTASKLLEGSYNSQKGNFSAHGGKFTLVLWGIVAGSQDPKKIKKISLSFSGTAVGKIWEYQKDINYDFDSQPCVVINGKGVSVPASAKGSGYFQPTFTPTTGGVNGFRLDTDMMMTLLMSPYYLNYKKNVQSFIEDQIIELDEAVAQTQAQEEDPNPFD